MRRPRWPCALPSMLAVVVTGCRCEDEPHSSPASSASAVTSARPPGPRLLYLPDAASLGTPAGALPSAPGPVLLPSGRCPPEMVDVRGQFCVDRYEASLVEQRSGRPLSPYYHPTPGQARATFERWSELALTSGPSSSREVPVPSPPEWQLSGGWVAKATSVRGVVPQGYLNRDVASAACQAAGKRLCTSEEWVTACRGQEGRKYPYGDRYETGRCNVFRESHPAAVLHGNASEGHLDPRLNQVTEGGEPLLRPTGATPDCRSVWGGDAAYDMVGNLDEWVSAPRSAFVGGFYARATREGCDARIEAHPPEYFDYSLGVRCCR